MRERALWLVSSLHALLGLGALAVLYRTMHEIGWFIQFAGEGPLVVLLSPPLLFSAAIGYLLWRGKTARLMVLLSSLYWAVLIGSSWSAMRVDLEQDFAFPLVPLLPSLLVGILLLISGAVLGWNLGWARNAEATRTAE